MTQKKLGTGQRKDDGKLRYDLINPLALEGMVKVLTKGAIKYEEHNWENGMLWGKVIGSLNRHLAAIMKGEDYDHYPETCSDCASGTCNNHMGELHVDLLQCNAHFLAAYYRIFPQGDNRFLRLREQPKIGLDIDEVICDWVGPWTKMWNTPEPTSWYFDYELIKKFDEMREKRVLNDFYLSLPAKCRPEEIPFEPHCYVTSRPIDTEITKKWLEKNGFPLRPVLTVPVGTSKIEAIRKAGVEIFVDDRFENYEELNRNGLCCFLFDAPHNQRYNVGYKRIKSLKELIV